MKRLLVAMLGLVCAPALLAQDFTDALRYGQEYQNGSARFQAMGGAFGALGGDLSALQINPAGSVIFKNSFASVSLVAGGNDVDSSYNGESRNSDDSDLSFAQIGGTWVFNSTDETQDWNRFAFSVNMDQMRNLDQNFDASGSTDFSISDYFVEQANGLPLNLLTLQGGERISDLYQFLGETEGFGAQQAFLGYQSFVIEANDPNDQNQTQYFSNVGAGPVNQFIAVSDRGANRKINFNFAAQYKQNTSIGINLNLHTIDSERFTTLQEDNNNGGLVSTIRYQNLLNTEAAGFSAQVGVIQKYDNLRLGLSYQTPTWYSVEEALLQEIATARSDGNGGTITEFIEPGVINLYEDYKLRVPGHLTASAAYLFGKKGLISADVTFRDYTSYQLDDDFGALDASDVVFEEDFNSSAVDYRLGAEYRASPKWSLRAGYRFQDSPFDDDELDGDISAWSAGLGYNLGKTQIDLAYDRATSNGFTQFTAAGLSDPVAFDRTLSNVTLTLGFQL